MGLDQTDAERTEAKWEMALRLRAAEAAMAAAAWQGAGAAHAISASPEASRAVEAELMRCRSLELAALEDAERAASAAAAAACRLLTEARVELAEERARRRQMEEAVEAAEASGAAGHAEVARALAERLAALVEVVDADERCAELEREAAEKTARMEELASAAVAGSTALAEVAGLEAQVRCLVAEGEAALPHDARRGGVLTGLARSASGGASARTGGRQLKKAQRRRQAAAAGVDVEHWMRVREHQRRLAVAVGGGDDWQLEAAHECWAARGAYCGEEESTQRFRQAAHATGVTIVEIGGEG